MNDTDRTNDNASTSTTSTTWSHEPLTPPADAGNHPDQGAGQPPGRRRMGLKTKIAAIGAALALAAGGGAIAVAESGSSSASGNGSTASGPGGAPGSGTAGRPGAGGGNLGFTPTAYHLAGTITAISGDTVTIKTPTATKDYTVSGSTHLRVSDASVTSLSSFKVGQTVMGSTTTSTGTDLNDLVTGLGDRAGGPGGAGGAGAPATAPGTSTS